MSRIGKSPVTIPKDVEVGLDGERLTVKGPKGKLHREIHPAVHLSVEKDKIIVSVADESKASRSLHGLFRALIQNMVTGVSQGFERELEIVGVGYRAEISGGTAVINAGYSQPIHFELPEGIEGKVEKNKIILRGIDKELLGLTAGRIRNLRTPEPYKGKGIRYIEEGVRRKAGKAGKAGK